MRILIDGMNLALRQGTGVATYARNLSYCVTRAGHDLSVLYGRNIRSPRAPVLREAVFLDTMERGGRALPVYLADLARSVLPAAPVEVPETGHVLRAELRAQLPRCDRILNLSSLFFKANAKFRMRLGALEVTPPAPVDIAHWTYPVPIRIRGAKNIYTIHDMVPLKLPYATLDSKTSHYRLLSWVARHADHVVTVSETSKRDILAMLPIEEARVTNTYQSVSLPPELLNSGEADLLTELRALSEGAVAASAVAAEGAKMGFAYREFYLYVGALEPKKNLRRIIEGYLAAGVDQPLVVVGRQAWQCEEEVKMMTRSPRIIYLDYIPLAHVVALMRAARALIFASLYEGFGLPVLEAFLCGAPVITADAHATREIAGDAALLVDPYDPRAIRDAIRRLSAEDSADLRAGLAAKGRARAEAFDEETIAARLDGFYRALLGNRRR